jgi:hypothetical protein
MVQSRQKQSAPKSEVEELKKEIAKLKKLIKSDSTKIENNMDEDNNEISISSDTYIKVMSLTPYLLTLTTQEYGRGKKFNFEKFGDVKRIFYHDLTDIMEQHPNFLNDGYFIILNEDVVKKHGLDEVYSKILTKEKLEQILVGNQSDAVNLFKACGESQREFISNMITSKMVAGEELDLNLLDRLSRIIGYNIAERGEEMKKFASAK